MNIKSLKSTRFGRAVVRLFGEEQGAVLMEYVVLAVLLVAAVVGAVIVFGNRARDSIDVSVTAMGGQTEQAAQKQEAATTRAATGMSNAEARGQRTNGGEY